MMKFIVANIFVIANPTEEAQHGVSNFTIEDQQKDQYNANQIQIKN